VASLVPAATDLLVAMGAADHLVAVSNFESDPRVKGLPRVGDYLNTDWETLATARPSAMLVQMKMVPPGLEANARRFKIRLVNLSIDRLPDVLTANKALGEVIGRPDLAAALDAKLRARLDAIKRRVARKAPVAALVVVSDSGRSLAGRENFLDDVLRLAGGTNAAGGLGSLWPKVDEETLAGMKPAVIIQLLPGASPQVLEKARAAWAATPGIPAVRDGRVHVITDDWALLPGSHVADLAERFEAALHPDDSSATRPATTMGSAR